MRVNQLFSIAITALCFIPLAPSCWAADFSTLFHSTYTVTTNRTVDVNHAITIINNSDTRYPTNYDVLLHSTDIENLKITNTETTINPIVLSKPTSTQISFSLPKPIVGRGKSQTYQLHYEDPGLILTHNPSTELFIPPLGMSDVNASISAQVTIPTTYCPSPITEPAATTTETANNVTTFSFENMTPQTSIFISCKQTRYVTLSLNYILENTNMTPIETQITLPPDTDYQRFSFSHINPKPINLTTDLDGNPIATFKLEPKQELRISVVANGIITSSPQPLTDTLTHKREYLANQPHWSVNDGAIKKYLNNLNSATDMSQLLTDNAQYSLTKTSDQIRQGSKAILHQPADLSGEDYVDARRIDEADC